MKPVVAARFLARADYNLVLTFIISLRRGAKGDLYGVILVDAGPTPDKNRRCDSTVVLCPRGERAVGKDQCAFRLCVGASYDERVVPDQVSAHPGEHNIVAIPSGADIDLTAVKKPACVHENFSSQSIGCLTANLLKQP